jgi:hypothetical protein
LEIASLDAPLLFLGELDPLRFRDQLPDLNRGVHINLYNNLWATNFTQWFGDPMRFSINLHFGVMN